MSLLKTEQLWFQEPTSGAELHTEGTVIKQCLCLILEIGAVPLLSSSDINNRGE